MREAIVLAGGLGTRLKSVTGDLPKPMAMVAGKPFLHHLFVQLKRWNIDRVILAVGYKFEIIEATFGEEYLGIQLSYSIEGTPMGTGGALRLAMEMLKTDSSFILNGDSYFNFPFDALEDTYKLKEADLAIALKQMDNAERYGTALLDKDHRVVRFEEKKQHSSGLINGGIYYANTSLLSRLPQTAVFSFENDYLKLAVEKDLVVGVPDDSYFIDIGIPQDYEKANRDFDI